MIGSYAKNQFPPTIGHDPLMPRVSELSIQDVRCFNSTQRARLGRITLLVGENSVGKSSFLGCYNAFANLSNLVDLTEDNPFDVSPFSMGSYDTIARSGTPDFTIAGQYDNHIHSAAQFSFGRGDGGQPFEKLVTFTFSGKNTPSTHISMSTGNGESGENILLSFQGPNFAFDIDWAEISFVPISTWLSRNVRHGFLPYNADRTTFEKRKGSPVTSDEIVEFGKFINFFRSEMPLPAGRCFYVRALEPSIPPRRRRYRDPPGYLSDAAERARINHVGTTLGLWGNIELSDATSGEGTEVVVTTVGGSHNLFDVGYGVHSLLPLVHAIAITDTPSIFLLQQPEVHVHPVAQAKLAQYMAEGPHDFIIETHSDHLVDRFRLCVMEQVLHPDELSILYFEKDKDGFESKIYNISVDSQGNVMNPPDSYREFFLTETERLLGLR